MANTPTLSLRVPNGQHELVRAVVARLKAAPGFADSLRALLAQAGETTGTPAEALPVLTDLARRVEAVERWIADREAVAVQAGVSTDALPGMQAETLLPPGGLLRIGTATAPAPAEPWTTGEGRMKRLTAAGLAELDRRLDAGETVADIAAALGVRKQTVGKRRAAAAG